MLRNLLNSNEDILIRSFPLHNYSILQTEWPCTYTLIHSTVLLDLLAAGMKFCETFELDLYSNYFFYKLAFY